MKAWLSGTAFAVGEITAVAAYVRIALLAEAEWIVLLLSAALLVAATTLDVGSTTLLARIQPDEPIDFISLSRLPPPVWVRRGVSTMAAGAAVGGLGAVLGYGWSLLLVAVIWLLPSLGARYAHNRSLDPGQ